MILKQCRDWLSGWSDCAPERKIAGLRQAVDELGAGRWEVSLRSDAADAGVGVRYFGEEKDFTKFAKAAAERFGLSAAAKPPKDGFPWLELWWDVEKDAPRFARLYDAEGAGETGGVRLAFKTSKLDKRFLADPALKEVFADLAGLCAIKDIISVWEKGKAREDWSLRFDDAVPWPDFARLSLAAPFTDGASLFSYVALDRRVSEILFTGGALVVYLRA